MSAEVLDSRTNPEMFPPVGLRFCMEPRRPKFNMYDLTTELIPVQLNQLLGWVHDDHKTHKLTMPLYSYTEGDCIHYADQPQAVIDDNEAYEDALIEKGEHCHGEDGYLCLDSPVAGLGCPECESSECERVGNLDEMVESFWDDIGQGFLS